MLFLSVIFLFNNFFDILFFVFVVIFFYGTKSLTQASLGPVKLEKLREIPPTKINDNDGNDEEHIEVTVRNQHPEELEKGVVGGI